MKSAAFVVSSPPPMPELEPGLINLAAIVAWIVLLISIIPIVLLLGSKQTGHTEK